jgi:molybdopterin-guanine dinucleotide biosynthesis protein A
LIRHNSAVILAGGQSRRMGRPKPALPFGRSTIIARLINELIDEFAELIVVAAPRAHEPYAVEELIGPWRDRVVLIRDEVQFAGPVPALVRGLRAARYPTVFVCSCDLPLLRADVARALCQMLGRYDAAVPVIDGRQQPLCAAYQRSSAGLIEALANAGEGRLIAVTERLNWRRIEQAALRPIDPELHSFLNVNTPADYSRALELALCS